MPAANELIGDSLANPTAAAVSEEIVPNSTVPAANETTSDSLANPTTAIASEDTGNKTMGTGVAVHANIAPALNNKISPSLNERTTSATQYKNPLWVTQKFVYDWTIS